jgi:hypothetical protein
MKTRIFMAAVVMLFASSSAFAQMGGYSGMGNANTQPPSAPNSGSAKTTTTTTTSKKVMPVGVKAYLDDVIAHSNDKKFHLTINGKDMPLTPIKVHEERKIGAGKASTTVEMKGADGATYEMDFFTSNGQVTGANKIRKINGKAP